MLANHWALWMAGILMLHEGIGQSCEIAPELRAVFRVPSWLDPT
jgi:hypothetical protein